MKISSNRRRVVITIITINPSLQQMGLHVQKNEVFKMLSTRWECGKANESNSTWEQQLFWNKKGRDSKQLSFWGADSNRQSGVQTMDWSLIQTGEIPCFWYNITTIDFWTGKKVNHPDLLSSWWNCRMAGITSTRWKCPMQAAKTKVVLKYVP